MPPSNNYKKRQSSIIFAKGTKRYDGTNTTEGANPANPRDSQAWAGMMMGDMDSDDDSDSDRSEADVRSRQPAPTSHPPSSSANNNGGGVRASWTTRAAAVGSRPPDTASQNPPSLKLLGLKSVKDGGIPLGSNGSSNANQPPLSPAISMRQEIERRQLEEQQRQGQQLRVEQQREAAIRNRTPSPAFDMVDEERRQMQHPQQARPTQQNSNNLRVTSNSEYGDDAGRHGSMIDFGGTDGFGSMDKMGNQMQNAPGNRGVQLQDEPVRYNQSSPERSQPQPQPRQQANLGPPQDPFANQPSSPRTALTQELGLGARSPSPYHGGMPNAQYQQGQQRNLVSPFQDPRPNQQPPPRSDSASSGMNQGRNPMGPPQQYQQQRPGNGPNGEIPLRRGPPPPLSLMAGGQGGGGGGQMNNHMTVPSGPSRGGPPSPHPIPLPSPVHIPGQPNMQRNGPGPGPDPRNGGPGGYQGMQPGPQQGGPMPRQGFSDAQGGPRNNPPARRPSLFRRSKAFLTGSNVGPSQQQQQQQQRKSLFRKSMALFTGRGNENGPMQQQHQNLDNGEDDSNAPAPRVQGFYDEKPKDRKSHYMGGGGMGDEWDYSGNGARFWKRFSIAQHKLQAGDFADSEEKRNKVARRKKITMFATLVGGLCIILAVVAVIIWRESTPTSDVPGAIDRSNGGADLSQTGSTQNAAAARTQTAAAAAASSASTSTARSAATQDDGSSGSGSNSDATTTTPKTKKHKERKHRKDSDDNTRRSIEDDGNSIEDIGALVKRQVEESIPSTARMLSVEKIASSHATNSMIRRRRQLLGAKQE